MDTNTIEFTFTNNNGNEDQARIENGLIIFHNHIKFTNKKL
jgi:hypothetical protein